MLKHFGLEKCTCIYANKLLCFNKKSTNISIKENTTCLICISKLTIIFCSMIPTDRDIAALPHFRRDQLMLTKFLGSGAFGEVFEGVAKNILDDNSGKTKVAVKVSVQSQSATKLSK